jgi:hypothetical protein
MPQSPSGFYQDGSLPKLGVTTQAEVMLKVVQSMKNIPKSENQLAEFNRIRKK